MEPRRLIFLFAALAAVPAAMAQTFHGPSPYLSVADSPFDLSGLGSTAFLEDFEDGRLNVPGAYSCSGEIYGPADPADSVDADDGEIDGLGQKGRSYFAYFGFEGIRFTFSEEALGALPKFAGIVWTDGGFGCSISFEAFDAKGKSLGLIDAQGVGDDSNNGTTAEDRFCGVSHAGGISAILMRNNSGGIEVDHIQYGGVPPQHVPACYPDCTGDGILNLFDFLCFVNAFNARQAYADCESGGCGFNLDLFDFLCFVNAFNAGCP